MAAVIEAKLRDKLSPTLLAITDNSNACGKNYAIDIVSSEFEGKPLIQRHRIIHSVLGEEMPGIHSLVLNCRTPSETS